MEIFYASSSDGSVVVLDAAESNHCARVLRHVPGDKISVIDGSGDLLQCRIVDIYPVRAVVEGREKDFGGHPYELTMAVCPTKNIDRYEWFVEKATEFGVDTIVPVIGDRSERRVVKTDRLERLVLSAAKQSLKGKIPSISAPVSVMDFIGGCDAELRLFACCYGDRKGMVDEISASAARSVAVLIGPEGDFSPEESEAALKAGFRPVHLGNSRLRTETAALAAVSIVYFSAKK